MSLYRKKDKGKKKKWKKSKGKKKKLKKGKKKKWKKKKGEYYEAIIDNTHAIASSNNAIDCGEEGREVMK